MLCSAKGETGFCTLKKLFSLERCSYKTFGFINFSRTQTPDAETFNILNLTLSCMKSIVIRFLIYPFVRHEIHFLYRSLPFKYPVFRSCHLEKNCCVN